MGKATQRDRTVVDPEKSKPFQKMAKRRSGLAKAINRLSKEGFELTEAYKLKKVYSDDETESHNVHYKPKNGKKEIVGYIVRHKNSRGGSLDPEKQKHTVYHGSDGENFKHETVVKGRKAAMAVIQRSHAKSSAFGEEYEQLDELSAKKLGQYQKKAVDDVDDRRIAHSNDMSLTYGDDREEEKLKQRKKGIKRAADKLVKKTTNEDVEQIDELKSKTLKSYISKANKDLSKRVADYHSKDIASSPSKIIKRDLAIDKAKGRLSMNRQLGRAEESVQINEFEMKTTAKGIKRHYELGKKQAAAGKEMGEVSDNYGPYGIHFERGYRDHQDAMAKKKKVNEAKMTDAQMDKREKIVMAMKPKMQGFKDRYGDDAKSVMYATATKQAMKEEIEEYDYIFESEYLKLSEEEQRLWEKVDRSSYDQLLHKKYQKPAKEYGERGKKSKVLDQIRRARGSINSRTGGDFPPKPGRYSEKGRKNQYATDFKVSKKDKAEMIYRKKSGKTGQIPSQRAEVRRDKSYDI